MVKNQKCKKELETREYNFKNRSSYYQTTDERLVLNVKNIDEIESIAIFDISGRLQHFENIRFTSHQIKVPYIGRGINIIEIKSKTGVIYKRIFI